MKAVVFKEKNTVAVENVPDPKIEAPGDVIIRITSAAICGSDLHMYEARSSARPGTVFGHENMGVVEEIGRAVLSIRVGDRVVLPFNVACGFCFNCSRGYTNACLTANPRAPPRDTDTRVWDPTAADRQNSSECLSPTSIA